MRTAALARLTPSVGRAPPKHGRERSSFHPRHVHTPRTPFEGDEPYESPRRGGGACEWWLTFQQTPCQMTGYVSPATAALRAVWVLVLYFVICGMVPIPEVSKSVAGVTAFISDVEFSSPARGDAARPEVPAVTEAAADASDAAVDAPAVNSADAPVAAPVANATRAQNTTVALAPGDAAAPAGGNSSASAAAVALVRRISAAGQRERRLRGRQELVLLQDASFSGAAGYEDDAAAGGSFSDVSTLDDVVYYTEALVGALFNEESYNGKPQDPLMLLRVHRLLSSVVVSQRRVKATDCAYELMKPFYPDCYESLEADTEDTRGWQGVPYDPLLGAVALHAPLDRARALEQVRELATGRWWDRATREASVRFVFHNAPGHFTGYCRVLFKLSPYGRVKPDVDVAFLRLQPYAAEVDGWQLALYQGMALACVLCLVGEVAYLAKQQVHVRWSVAYLLRPWAIFDYVLFFWVCTACGAWIEYMQNPARTQFSAVTGAPEFSELADMAEQFSGITFLLSVLLLLSVLRITEYLTMMPEVGEMYRILAKAVSDMMYFTILLILLFIGFTLAGHLLFGPTVPMFSGLDSTMHHLILWFFALGGGHEELFERPGGVLFLLMFFFALMIVLFNMFIGIVTNAFDAVAEEDQGHVLIKPWNHRAADWLCDKLGVPQFASDPYNSPAKFGFHPDSRPSPSYAFDDAPAPLERQESEAPELLPAPPRRSREGTPTGEIPGRSP